jgi:signal transduction histidine kinase
MNSFAPVLVRRAGTLVAGTAFLVALMLGFGVLGDRIALVVSDAVYPAVALATAALLVIGSFSRSGADRRSWAVIGCGVALLGMGELVWGWYELGLDVEPPFPGLPDVFYLAAYPVLALGMLAMPRLSASRYQWSLQMIDALVVTAGVAIFAWLMVFAPMYQDSSGSTYAELAVGAGYPVGDVLLIAVIGAVGIGRSLHLRDRSLWCLIAGLLAMAVGDIAYLTQSWSTSYESGSWLDATWLASYGLFALGAARLPDRLERRQPRQRRLPLWHVLGPVAALIAIVGLQIVRKVQSGEGGSIGYDLAITLLGFVVLFRIILSVAEDRRLLAAERDHLISVVSHELRTPLTAVQGYLEMLDAEWDALDEPTRREMVAVAEDQARFLGRIVTDLVAASRDQLNSTDLVREVVDVAGIVSRVVNNLGLGNVASIAVAQGTGVVADRERLVQILTNLMTNATQYGSGSIACVARRVGGQVDIEVHDNGPGVPPRYRDSIWDRFERGAYRFDAATPGSGLGLAVVRSLVEAHDGAVGHRPSRLLGGECFWVRLPASVELTAFGPSLAPETTSA